MEDRRARFKRIAENRTNRILKNVRLLGNCSNKSAYDYDEEDIKKIFNEINKALKEAKAKFKFNKKKDKFSL